MKKKSLKETEELWSTQVVGPSIIFLNFMLSKSSETSLLLVIFATLSFIGFVDSLYLTVSHIEGVPPVCNFLDGCGIVTTSEYATWGNFPVSGIGLVYYLLLFFFSITYMSAENKRFMKLGLYLTLFGFLASLWFVYLQFFVIEAVCLYCLISALTSTLLFVVAMIILNKGLKNL